MKLTTSANQIIIANGPPILHKDGYHQWTSQFDARGNQIATAFFSTDGQPIAIRNGIHRVTQQFDELDNVVDKQFFDVNGQPIRSK